MHLLESNILYRSLSYEKVFAAKIFSIHGVHKSGLKLNYEKRISIQCFRRRPQQVSLVRPLHCDVEWMKNHKRCIKSVGKGATAAQ